MPEYIVTFLAFHVNAMGSISHDRFQPDSPILTKIGQNVSCNDKLRQAKQFFFVVSGSSFVPENWVQFPFSMLMKLNLFRTTDFDRIVRSLQKSVKIFLATTSYDGQNSFSSLFLFRHLCPKM